MFFCFLFWFFLAIDELSVGGGEKCHFKKKTSSSTPPVFSPQLHFAITTRSATERTTSSRAAFSSGPALAGSARTFPVSWRCFSFSCFTSFVHLLRARELSRSLAFERSPFTHLFPPLFSFPLPSKKKKKKKKKNLIQQRGTTRRRPPRWATSPATTSTPPPRRRAS